MKKNRLATRHQALIYHTPSRPYRSTPQETQHATEISASLSLRLVFCDVTFVLMKLSMYVIGSANGLFCSGPELLSCPAG